MAKSCPYCTLQGKSIDYCEPPKKDLFVIPIRLGRVEMPAFAGGIYLEEEKAVISVSALDYSKEYKINYCPMCGRDLNKYIDELMALEVNNGR